MAWRYRGTGAALVALVFLLSCGSDDDSGGGGSGGGSNVGDDACGLLTSAEVEAEVGNPVLDGVKQSGGICYWNGETLGKVSVHVDFVAPPPSPAEQCKSWRTGPDPWVDVSGFGSEAFFRYKAAGDMSNSDLVVCLSSGVVWLALDGNAGEAAMRTASENLMKLVLPRL